MLADAIYKDGFGPGQVTISGAPSYIIGINMTPHDFTTTGQIVSENPMLGIEKCVRPMHINNVLADSDSGRAAVVNPLI